MVRLSKRLHAIAKKVTEGSRVADIGTDHALLPVFLAKEGRIPFAVAGDVNPGPVETARGQVSRAGLQQVIDVRQGDGLHILSPGEVDVVIIAGMGGALICDILSAGQSRLNGVRRLILQPNVGEDLVRRWLRENGWFLQEEELLEEDGKFYEIFAACPADNPKLQKQSDGLYQARVLPTGTVLDTDLLFALGPYLTLSPTEAFFRKWRGEMTKMERIIGQLGRSGEASARKKRAQMQEKLARLKEVLSCLQKDKP